MPKYTENDLQNALASITTGMPVKRAAQQWGVPESTIRNRIKGRTPRALAYTPYQRLVPEQEKALAHWILGQAILGSPLTHAQLRGLAQHILYQGGDERPLGVNWI